MEIEIKSNKNSPETKTCSNKNFNNFFEGLNNQTKDTFFFSFIIQFLLVLLMYIHVGNGKYWKVLLWGSLLGLIGALIEHSTIAFICQKSKADDNGIVVPFLIEELFWIPCEYAIPYLNLIKMETVAKTRNSHMIKSIIIFLFIPFSIVRLINGYDRMMKGYLNTENTKTYHGIAFGVMGIADIICTFSVFYFMKRHNIKGSMSNVNLFSSIKTSSYTILITIDIVSFILSALYIINTLIPSNTTFESSANLFHCLKSVFILILTTDALIFKYLVNTGNNVYISNSSFESDSNLKESSKHYSIKVSPSNAPSEKNSNTGKIFKSNSGEKYSSVPTNNENSNTTSNLKLSEDDNTTN